jgi:type VI secretion system secreted protein Hcp
MGEMFLDLDGFTGESLDYDHLDEIELIGWGWGIKNNASFNIRDVREGATHTAFDHLTITKVVDSASVTLVQFCAQGNHISKGYLACRKNTGERTNLSDFLTIEFSDLKVLSVTWPEKGAEDHGYPEIVVFQFSKFDMTYKKQANEGELYGSMNFPFSIPDQKVS